MQQTNKPECEQQAIPPTPPSRPREGRGEGEGARKKKEPAKQERRQSLGRKGGGRGEQGRLPWSELSHF